MLTIVPKSIDARRADVFVGCFEETRPAGPLSLLLGRGGATRKVADVVLGHVIEGGKAPPIRCWTGRIEGLDPGCRYDLQLRADAAAGPLASGWIETLPERLPTGVCGTGNMRPFTVWLSSCFSARRSPPGLERAIARAFGDPRRRPHLKFLVGDQVYLDDDLFFLNHPALSDRDLRTRFNQQYARSFTHPGFASLLAAGGTYFLPDDHELWNNYPHPPSGVWLRRDGFWARWRRFAYDERCLTIQAPVTGPVFDLAGELSFFVADLRTQRTTDRARFMDPPKMAELTGWLEKLGTPGVLVVQQPILDDPGSPRDRKLQDYDQYWTDLLPALRRCRQDLVVLAGDAHCGHVATTPLGAPGRAGDEPGPRLIQVVSSPLSLVNPLAAGTPLSRPLRLPAASGIEATPVQNEMVVPTYRCGGVERSEEHGMTVSFWKPDPSHLRLRVQTYLTRSASRAPAPAWETTLPLR